MNCIVTKNLSWRNTKTFAAQYCTQQIIVPCVGGKNDGGELFLVFMNFYFFWCTLNLFSTWVRYLWTNFSYGDCHNQNNLESKDLGKLVKFSNHLFIFTFLQQVCIFVVPKSLVLFMIKRSNLDYCLSQVNIKKMNCWKQLEVVTKRSLWRI